MCGERVKLLTVVSSEEFEFFTDRVSFKTIFDLGIKRIFKRCTNLLVF